MPPEIEQVLLATDGSEPAERAAEHAIALAAATGADLHAVAVVGTAPSRLLRNTIGDDDGLAESGEAAVAGVAEQAQAHATPPEVTTAVRRGRPHVAVVDYAEEIDADLIVAGTEGRAGLDRVLLGSVAENLLRSAPLPVLVVPPGAPSPPGLGTDDGGTDTSGMAPVPYREFLLPTDGSECAERALDWAVALTDRFEGSLHALFAADVSPYPATVQSRQLLESLRSAGNDAIETVRERAGAAGVDVEGAVGSGAPGPTIIEFCEDEAIDLVVMGTHGRSGVERAILGSVTEHVVRHGNVPVFCVPPAEDGGE